MLEALAARLDGWRAPDGLARTLTPSASRRGTKPCDAATARRSQGALPTDAQVIGAVQRAAGEDAVVVCAAGGLPGELHKLWRTRKPGGYHVEYGYSCMGYEIAGGLGVKLAAPERDVFVMVGDGCYLMMNSEIATSVMLGAKLIVVVLDNRGFGCINRLQQVDRRRIVQQPAGRRAARDAARHRLRRPRREPRRARGEGRQHRRAGSGAGRAPRPPTAPSVIVIDTDPADHHRGRRLLVGRGGAGSLRARRRCAPRARPTKTRSDREGRRA